MSLPLSKRQRKINDDRSAVGYVAPLLGKPESFTLRTLGQLAPAGGAKPATIRKRVGAGAKRIFDEIGTPVNTPAAVDIVGRHQALAARIPVKSTYAAVSFDAHMRPERTLVIPNRRFGTHSRGATESHGLSAAPTDHRGHSVSQAMVSLPPGVHHATMTSQSAEMNTAVQLPLERAMNKLLSLNRKPQWEVQNHFSGPTAPGSLPRPTKQTFTLLSTDSSGTDLRMHTHAAITQR